MTTFVLDTNIISYHLKDNQTVVKNAKNAAALKNEILLAPFAYYEVKRGLVAVNAKNRLQRFADLCSIYTVGCLENNILDIAADIYVELKNKGRPADDVDILIAACGKARCFIS
jgi:predicted nucleic acid-binding protein